MMQTQFIILYTFCLIFQELKHCKYILCCTLFCELFLISVHTKASGMLQTSFSYFCSLIQVIVCCKQSRSLWIQNISRRSLAVVVGWKKRMTTQNRQKSNAKKKQKKT